jgi:hypothetical protein
LYHQPRINTTHSARSASRFRLGLVSIFTICIVNVDSIAIVATCSFSVPPSSISTALRGFS